MRLPDEIIKGNQQIAIFMGAQWSQDDYGDWGYRSVTFPHWNKGQRAEALQYYNSWEWLMPVVEKIENGLTNKRKFKFAIEFNHIKVTNTDHEGPYCPVDKIYMDSKIDAVWSGVLEFIKWYNLNFV